MAKAKESIIETEEEVQTVEKKVVPAKKTPRKYDMTEYIPCRSITYGELIVEGKKSKIIYSWADCGDVTMVEFGDLQALRSARSNFIFKPRFIIEDPELIEQWPELKPLYERLEQADINEIMNAPLAKFKSKLKSAPVGVQQAVKNLASSMILDGTLDSIAKIKAVDEILGTDLKLLINQ